MAYDKIASKKPRSRVKGRNLITRSIVGFVSSSFRAVYNGSEAFSNSFSFALRNELKDTGMTVSMLLPGTTDTEFFARSDMLNTQVGQDDKKSDPANVAQVGFDAMMAGEVEVVAG